MGWDENDVIEEIWYMLTCRTELRARLESEEMRKQ